MKARLSASVFVAFKAVQLSMKDIRAKAFTLIELLVIMLIAVILAGLLITALVRAKHRAQRIRCTSNLKQIGMATKTWAIDHTNQYPTQVEVKFGGAREPVAAGEVFRFFQVMSNELSTPFILACPADIRRPPRDFGSSFSNTNVSYFLGIAAEDSQPNMFLSGDRNLTNGTPLVNGMLVLTTNRPVGWTHELHNGCGQVLLSDGSVQQLSSGGVTRAVQASGATNRLAMP